jgi:ferredoxin-NADP reductase
MKFTSSATKQEANDTFSFIFAPEQPLQWKAGQLLRHELNHPNPDDRGVERFFSIASAPHEKHVMLTTRFASKSSSFKKALKNLRRGDAIEAHDLEGDFVVDDSRKTFVFIAGGIGITPFRAILLDLDYNRKPLNVQLLYANRDVRSSRARLNTPASNHVKDEYHKSDDQDNVDQTASDVHEKSEPPQDDKNERDNK